MTLLYAIITSAIIGIIGYIYWLYTHNTYIVRINKDQIMEFKTSFELTGLPIIVFYQGDKKFNFLMDSGSNISYVNKSANINIQMTDTKDVFMGANGTDISCQYANIKLYRSDTEYAYTVAVTDLDAAFAEIKNVYGVSLTGIIGCDFMNKYSYCLDFKELVVYKRK